MTKNRFKNPNGLSSVQACLIFKETRGSSQYIRLGKVDLEFRSGRTFLRVDPNQGQTRPILDWFQERCTGGPF